MENTLEKRFRVGILGATGMVGQQLITLLRDHPWFSVVAVAASESSAKKTYAEAVAGRWHFPLAIPTDVASLKVRNVSEVAAMVKECDFVFSALDSGPAGEFEEKYAKHIPVISNASFHRWTKDVPLLIPEINPEHLSIIAQQQKSRGWKGFIVVKPNCSLQSYLPALFALQAFSPVQVMVTTMQAVSGAGYPGVPSLAITENVVPYIGGEEEKSEKEPLKILGTVRNGQIVNDASMHISAHCNRVPVIDGHTACVSVKFSRKPTKRQILDAWKGFSGLPQKYKLPSAPIPFLIYREEDNRPQPRLDRDAGRGMAMTIGRLREDPVFDWKFVAMSHNTIRGASGGSILTAELLVHEGYIRQE